MILKPYLPLILVIFFATTLAFSVLINRLMLRFSVNLGVRNLDETNMVRWTADTKPSVGGIPMYIVFLLSICVFAILPLERTSIINRQLFGLFSACTLGFLIGLADDAYNTNPMLKFLGQLTCANLLIATDIYIELTPILGVNYAFTVFWVVGLMNSINMLDNMDGITGSISAAITGTTLMLLIAHGSENYLMLFVLLGVFASLIGFLLFNWHPAKIYMGDTGSQFLGVFLAAVGIMFFWQFREESGELIQIKQFVLPLIVFILPIIDTTTVFIRRIARGQSPFVGGKDHTTHHLAFLGLSDTSVARVFVIISLVSVGLSYLVFEFMDTWNYTYSFCAILYFILLFTAFQILYDRAKKKLAKKELAKDD